MKALIVCAKCGSPAVQDISYCGEHYCQDCFERKISEINKENEK